MFVAVLLAIAGIALLIAVGVVGLLFLLSYFRMPTGSHKDAGEGALTVAMLIAQIDKPPARAKEEEKVVSVRLFSVNVISGYDAASTGRHHSAEPPGPTAWTLPSPIEQTSEILAVPVAESSPALASAA